MQMAWFKRMETPKLKELSKKASVPTGLWTKCGSCGIATMAKDLEKQLKVCPECGYHFRLSGRLRLKSFLDEDSFEEMASHLAAADPLSFSDSQDYGSRVARAQNRSQENEAFVLGQGKVLGRTLVAGAFVFDFMGGSMGSVVGEKISLAFEAAIEARCPVIIFSASGGARMQEGILSLMQMAKTSVVLNQFREIRQPFISVLTDPTTGGVAASMAMLGDIIIAEPEALVGFAGPRVIEQTIGQTLPEGFQRSEFLLEHGVIDMIVPRPELRERIASLIDMLTASA
jgi:acetyl-CoA carboxylase carboxyl transferase subunit beta